MSLALRCGLVGLLCAAAAPVAAQRAGPVLTLDAAVSGMFDNNVGRNAQAVDAYGGGGELLLRLASSPSRPAFQLEYAASMRRSSDPNPADGPGHRLSARAGLGITRSLHADIVARAGRGGVDEDLSPADEALLLARLELQPARNTRLLGYGGARRRDAGAGTVPTFGQYVGLELRQQLGGRTTLLLDVRYEESHPADSTRLWHRNSAELGVGRSVTRNTALELEARYRQRLHPLRMVESDDGEVPRRDDDTRAALSLVHENGHGLELRLELEHAARTSTDPRRGYDASRVNLMLRQRIFGAGRGQPPRIDERAGREALRARRTVDGDAAAAASARAVTVAGTTVCILDGTGAATCRPAADDSGPGPAAAGATVNGTWTQIAAGPGRACALDAAGAAACWNRDDPALHGPATAQPPRALRTDLRFHALTVGGAHACGLSDDGAAWCWGDNAEGQLGTGTAISSTVPVRVAVAVPLRAISAGSRHTCALAADGTAWCWGANENSQAAAGALRRTLQPRPIEGFRFVQLSAGTRHNCALTADGAAWCWGENSGGRAGQPGGGHLTRPARVPGAVAFSSVAAGWAHTCALDTTGRAWCWGRNDAGQLGTGAADDGAHERPQPVAGDRVFTALAAAYRTCALHTRQRVYCWGRGLTKESGGALAPAPLDPLGRPARR